MITILVFGVYAWPWYNFVKPSMAGLPFFYWWIIVWYLISSIILYAAVNLRVKGGAS
ncbi:MAG: hypothetical protein C0171_01865 [Caldisphaera sp.]|nr:MAG: hypothetical protein C0171_01865 [Caldisphaera sp.]